jgi:hypothetical protein
VNHLNTPGGHIAVLLFLTLVGLIAVARGVSHSDYILLASFAALIARLATVNRPRP